MWKNETVNKNTEPNNFAKNTNKTNQTNQTSLNDVNGEVVKLLSGCKYILNGINLLIYVEIYYPWSTSLSPMVSWHNAKSIRCENDTGEKEKRKKNAM